MDPAWYFSAPGLACDATLKITKIQLELLSDPDMLLIIESGIRGGIATISRHHAKANNEYIWTEFDPAEESQFISYLDANNLYGWALSKQLPTSGFKWMTDNELDDWKHLNCFLEFDLEYSKDLHDLRNDYPKQMWISHEYENYLPAVKFVMVVVILSFFSPVLVCFFVILIL